MRAAYCNEGLRIARLIKDLQEVTAELANDHATNDRSFWLWVDSTDLQKAYDLLEAVVANIDDDRAGLKS
jgi:hypothetical protein